MFVLLIMIIMINVSVADDQGDTKIIEPWFLNAMNKLSNSNTSKKVLKIDAFMIARLGAFKSNKKEYEKYKGKKGSEVYWKLMENVVESLVKRRFIRRHVHPAYVLITNSGITMCNLEGEHGWHSKYYPLKSNHLRNHSLR
jgi:hypothetical protein